MKVRDRIFLSVLAGFLAGVTSIYMPNTVLYKEVQDGDMGAPLLGLNSFLSISSAYNKLTFNSSINTFLVINYTFATMLFLFLISLIPLLFIASLLCLSVSAIFAYGLLYDGKPLLSVPFLALLEPAQIVPLIPSVILVPCPLPVAVLKPQLGIELLAVGD